jgi:hypothetical protein
MPEKRAMRGKNYSTQLEKNKGRHYCGDLSFLLILSHTIPILQTPADT